MVEMGDKKLEEFLRRNDLTDLGEIFRGIYDELYWHEIFTIYGQS